MSSKSVTVLLEQKIIKTEKISQKALRSFWKKIIQIKNFLKKCDSFSRKKVKSWKMPWKSVIALLEKRKKTEKSPQKALQHFSEKD